MKSSLYVLLAVFLCAGCKGKKKEPKDTSEYFPILAYLRSQVKDLDTSLYNIRKIETAGGRSDTTYLKREQVRQYAQDFLDIPDLDKPESGSDYTETQNYDELVGRVYKSYTADDEDLEVRKQEITILPTFGGNDQVKSIYIEKRKERGDSTVSKKMLWEVGSFFNITTIVQKGNEEKISKLQLFWEGGPSNN